MRELAKRSWVDLETLARTIAEAERKDKHGECAAERAAILDEIEKIRKIRWPGIEVPERKPIPPGFVKCEVCGEYNGSTSRENLDWFCPEGFEPGEMTSVSCLCKGIPCPICKKNKVHRPCSNSYEEDTNHIGHWPYFTGQSGCWECVRKREQQKNASNQSDG